MTKQKSKSVVDEVGKDRGKKRTRLLDLEGEVGSAMPIGIPRLVRLCGYEVGINYIEAIGRKNGVANEDRGKLDYAFLHRIERDAPNEANAFSTSGLVNLCGEYGLRVAKAVQYYKLIE